MALTGLDIYKLLPKTNCGKCNSPTCLAFAMKLAQKKAALEECPFVTEETKQTLAAASEPPMRTVTIGATDRKLELGGETVIFRHEKTFFHPAGIGVTFSDNCSPEELSQQINKFNRLEFDRVGQKVKTEIAVIVNDSGDKDKFVNTVREIQSKTKASMILVSLNPTIIEEALKISKDNKPLIHSATNDNVDQMVNLAKTYNVPLAVKGNDLDEIACLVQKIVATGFKELVLDLTDPNPTVCLENLTQVRRLALKKNFRPLGFPVMTFVNTGNELSNAGLAATYIAKYSSMVIVPQPEDWQHLALVTIRQNIYTDPQKPVIVEPKLYTIGGTPTDKSPLLITTNFSLTYFTVEPEIVNAKVPSWLLVCDSEGMSVLTAWAAEKFTADTVVNAMKKVDIESKVSHRKLIIPGYVAVMSGKLNELSGWEVMVGPREASGIPKFLRTMWVS